MKRCAFTCVLFLIALMASPAPAHAYIGPGLAGGTVSTLLGSASAISMLAAGAVWYPIRRAIHALRGRHE